MTEYTVEAENLVKEFGDVRAVDEISFQIQEGEFFSLLGPSGCGKTTTLRMIAGFERPTDGVVSIENQRVNEVPPYDRETGMVFQGYALFPHKTVEENIAFGLKMGDVPKEERSSRVAEMLDLVGLPGMQDRQPSELSGGQQQRVALARALIIEPSVLLLDEPLSNLDLKLRKEMRFELQRIQSELDITTIYVTHDQEEALSMSDRILVMNEGRAEQVDDPLSIYQEPTSEFVADFIGDTNLLRGTVESRENGDVIVNLDLAPDKSLRVSPGVVRADSVSEGQSVLLNLRPENIVTTPDSDVSNHLTGTAKAKTFLGKSTRILMTVGGSELEIEERGQRAYRTHQSGDEITIGWKPDDCLLMADNHE